MRLNINKYQEIMQERSIEKADIERLTGITVQTLDWIFKMSIWKYLHWKDWRRLWSAMRKKSLYRITMAMRT